jgi:phage anti-repressor protein
MEQIVKNSKSLSWDGWDVINRYKSEKARTSKYGQHINGRWYMVKRFKPTRNGWDIPESLINAQT